MNGLSKLVGRKIVSASMNGGNVYIETETGAVKLEPYGDCCSSCYIQHISGTNAFEKGAIVQSVEDIDSEPTAEELAEASDVLNGWGHRITTTKGVCSIEMRLSHNGYYGGSLDLSVHKGPLPGEALDDY